MDVLLRAVFWLDLNSSPCNRMSMESYSRFITRILEFESIYIFFFVFELSPSNLMFKSKKIEQLIRQNLRAKWGEQCFLHYMEKKHHSTLETDNFKDNFRYRNYYRMIELNSFHKDLCEVLIWNWKTESGSGGIYFEKYIVLYELKCSTFCSTTTFDFCQQYLRNGF